MHMLGQHGIRRSHHIFRRGSNMSFKSNEWSEHKLTQWHRMQIAYNMSHFEMIASTQALEESQRKYGVIPT